jgi:hypothetical protein
LTHGGFVAFCLGSEFQLFDQVTLDDVTVSTAQGIDDITVNLF